MAEPSGGEAAEGRGVTGRLHVGTSGWHYAGWWGPFYPRNVRRRDALGYYATRFDAVELNAPYYRLPSASAVQGWFDATPDNFRFAWKASRFITHLKRLKVDRRSVDLMEARLSILRHKAGPVLFQLPPRMTLDIGRLSALLAMLPEGSRYAFEFRNPGWYVPSVLTLLHDHDAALCISDHASAPAPREVTASWVYIRNHGPGGRYFGSYSDDALIEWARAIRSWSDEGRDVWCFFDNDVKSAAPADAGRLKAFISVA